MKLKKFESFSEGKSYLDGMKTMKDIKNLEWNDMLDLPYDGLLSIRCYFLGEDGRNKTI